MDLLMFVKQKRCNRFYPTSSHIVPGTSYLVHRTSYISKFYLVAKIRNAIFSVVRHVGPCSPGRIMLFAMDLSS